MAVHKQKNDRLVTKEHYLYGSSRLGSIQDSTFVTTLDPHSNTNRYASTLVYPEKEFLITVAEESAHYLQNFVEIPIGGVRTQEQYENIEHEKGVQPVLREVEKQYDENKNRSK